MLDKQGCVSKSRARLPAGSPRQFQTSQVVPDHWVLPTTCELEEAVSQLHSTEGAAAARCRIRGLSKVTQQLSG